MDWYLGCAIDDLVVPNNQDILEMLPSPNGWPHWDLFTSEMFEPMSKNFGCQTDFTGNGLSGFHKKSKYKAGMDLFEQQLDENSFNSNSHQQLKVSSCEISDYQIDDVDTAKETNDIFSNSSHEIGMDTSSGPFNYYDPEVENDEYGTFSSDNLFNDMAIDSEYNPSHLYGMGSSKYLRTHAFSPPPGEVARIYTPQKLKDIPTSPVKAHLEDASVSSEFEIYDEDVNEEKDMEACILQDLETVTTQMSENTRICFRDAFYRLAENSRQQSLNLLLKKPTMLVHDENYGSNNNKIMESETNVIDRTVANLMFCKIDYNEQAHPQSDSLGDAEVPTFSK